MPTKKKKSKEKRARTKGGKFVKKKRKRARTMPKKKNGKKRNGRKFPPLGVVAGGIVSLISAKSYYDQLILNGWKTEDAATLILTGLDVSGANVNDATSIGLRWGKVYGGILGGVVVHEVIGNPRGAFGTGIGAKLNNKMGKFPI